LSFQVTHVPPQVDSSRIPFEILPGTRQDGCMTGKTTIEAKKHSGATAVGVKARANASAAGLKKGAKVRPEILTEDQRYELARKAEEARIVRHDLRDRLREKA
jgi:hypothetical protein